MNTLLRHTAVTSLALFVLACNEPPMGPDAAGVDLQSLVAELGDTGAEVTLEGHIANPPFWSNGHVLTVNRHRVDAYLFESVADAEQAASGISPDGSAISEDGKATQVEWVDVPHFFASGRLIVLYVGRDKSGGRTT